MDTKRKGLCTNFGNCKNAESKLPIEVDITADFICPECSRDLTELVEKNFWKSLKKKTVIVVVIVLLAVLGIYITILKLTKNVTEKIVDKGVNIIENSIEDISKTTKTETEAIIDSAVSPLEETTQQEVKENEDERIPSNPTKQPPSPHDTIGWKTFTFDYGKYTGQVKNGLMHGVGEFHYTIRHIISEKDWKKRFAEAGDVLKGSWN